MKFAPQIFNIVVRIVSPVHLPVLLFDSCHSLRFNVKMNQFMFLFNGPIVFLVEVVNVVAFLWGSMHFFDVLETLDNSFIFLEISFQNFVIKICCFFFVYLYVSSDIHIEDGFHYFYEDLVSLRKEISAVEEVCYDNSHLNLLSFYVFVAVFVNESLKSPEGLGGHAMSDGFVS